MTLAAVFSAAMTALEGAGLSVYPAGSIYYSGDTLITPSTQDFVVLDIITDTPLVEWTCVKWYRGRLQITSFSDRLSTALSQIEAARGALDPPDWTPDLMGPLRRLGPRYRVLSQDFINVH